MLRFITDIENNINSTFEDLDKWIDEPIGVRVYQPKNGGWSINEILEHISLTNHYLLILIDKGYNKAIKNVLNLSLEQELKNYSADNRKLDEISIYKKFNWIRPEHMEPTGSKSIKEIKQCLISQKLICLDYLNKMPNGEGVQYKITMTVNNLGKINVYEYILFLSYHSIRHISQMQNCKNEYKIHLKNKL